MSKHPLNPNYGQGIFRRRIRLENINNYVLAELEDCNHGFRLRLYHDHKTISAIEVETLRYPLSTCSNAGQPLQALLGCALTTQIDRILKYTRPRDNCTHLFDLASLAIVHATRAERTRIYDIEVPDSTSATSDLLVRCNGELIHQWQAREHKLCAPAALNDKPLMKGFYLWVFKQFSGEQLEAALVLQKGYFVSRARHLDLDASAGMAASGDLFMLGACYTYSPAIVDKAFREANSVRDFSDCPERLLKFV
jgi:hypothetical protein